MSFILCFNFKFFSCNAWRNSNKCHCCISHSLWLILFFYTSKTNLILNSTIHMKYEKDLTLVSNCGEENLQDL